MMSYVMVGQELGFVDYMNESVPKVIAMVLADILSLGIGLLVIIQIRLLYLNTTSFEVGIDNTRRPYKKKSCVRNL